MKLILASRNPHKLIELTALLPGLELLPWPPSAPEIPETGAFFQDNALQKAQFALDWWSEHETEKIHGALADDSGLCVDALWGGPGVLSARFAPDLPQFKKNCRLLEMIPLGASRSARFVCVLALTRPDQAPLIVSGCVEGRLGLEPKGEEGFGYDPLFIPETWDRSFGELGSCVKHQLSHRGRACRALLESLGLPISEESFEGDASALAKRNLDTSKR